MAESARPVSRSRSNSLQRMLSLEKKLSHLRTQDPTKKHYPPSPAVTQPRRFGLVNKEQRAPPIPVRQHSSVPSTPAPQSAFTSEDEISSASSDPATPHTEASSPTARQSMDKHSPKNVAFMFPPQVETAKPICHSPTWEAHDRLRKERKEEKKEAKKEKEQVVKERPRGRRLVKSPPSYLTPSRERGRSPKEVEAKPPPPPPPKRRSSSFLGISLSRSSKDESDSPKRGRSGSLSSLFRSSFEIRRASFDQTSSTGFLGGMRLDKKKQDFHQNVLDDQANGHSTVHPALRKSFQGHGSFTPFKTTGPPGRDKEADAQRRAYPPISIKTQPNARGQPADPTNIYLWSARADKTSQSMSDECAVADDDEESGEQKHPQTPSEEKPSSPTETGLARRGGIHVKTTRNKNQQPGSASDSSDKESGSDKKESSPMPSPPTLKKVELHETIILDETGRARATSEPQKKKTASRPELRARGESSTSDSTSAPPAPPPRSSRRNPDSSASSQSSDKERSSSESLNPFKDKRPPLSVRYETTSAGMQPKPFPEPRPAIATSNKWNLKGAAKSAFGRGHSASSSIASITSMSPTSPTSPASISPIAPAAKLVKPATGRNTAEQPRIPISMETQGTYRPMTSSSESSFSTDRLHSSKIPGTPDSTPPQSEKNMPMNFSNSKRVFPTTETAAKKQSRPARVRQSVYPSTESEDSDCDPIEAAARRVLEAFSNANLRSPATSSKDTDSSSNESHYQPPSAIQQRPSLRHKGKSQSRLRQPSAEQAEQAHFVKKESVLPPVPLRVSRATVPTAPDAVPRKPIRHQTRPEASHQSKDAVAKMFVECCRCKFYQDMPSQLYEAMVHPEGVLTPTRQQGFMGKVSMTVACPWCEHEMSIKCCAGFAARVIIQEQFH